MLVRKGWEALGSYATSGRDLATHRLNRRDGAVKRKDVRAKVDAELIRLGIAHPNKVSNVDAARILGLLPAFRSAFGQSSPRLLHEWAVGGINKDPCQEFVQAIIADHLADSRKENREPRKKFKPKALSSRRRQHSPAHQHVISDDFLGTYEWRRLRMEALKKYGSRCQCCGATPKDGAVMNVDHIKPRRIYPELALSLDNLQVLCHECNHGKGNWDMTDWREVSNANKEAEQ